MGQKLRFSFYWGSFSERGASYYWCYGGRFWGRVQVDGGGWVFLWKMREKGKGVGRVVGGVGTGKGTGESMRTIPSKQPSSVLPFSLFPMIATQTNCDCSCKQGKEPSLLSHLLASSYPCPLLFSLVCNTSRQLTAYVDCLRVAIGDFSFQAPTPHVC